MIDKSEKSVDNKVEWAEYEFSPIETGIYDINSLLYNLNEKFSSSDEITIEKKSKKGIKKTINIKPSVKSFGIRDNRIVMILKTGQNTNVPALRADNAIELFLPDIKFEIKRTKFFDEALKEIFL